MLFRYNGVIVYLKKLKDAYYLHIRVVGFDHDNFRSLVKLKLALFLFKFLWGNSLLLWHIALQECLSIEPFSKDDEPRGFVVTESRCINNNINILLRSVVQKKKISCKGNFANKAIWMVVSSGMSVFQLPVT